MQSEVEILGHKVSSEGLSPLDNKVQVIKAWNPPTTYKVFYVKTDYNNTKTLL